jgi:hypothetical protein
MAMMAAQVSMLNPPIRLYYILCGSGGKVDHNRASLQNKSIPGEVFSCRQGSNLSVNIIGYCSQGK